MVEGLAILGWMLALVMTVMSVILYNEKRGLLDDLAHTSAGLKIWMDRYTKLQKLLHEIFHSFNEATKAHALQEGVPLNLWDEPE